MLTFKDFAVIAREDMTDFRVMRYSEKKLRDPIAVVGFPSVGLVGSIVSSYLSRDLNLEVVAGMTSADLPPYTLVQNGNSYPPIRFYGGRVPKPRAKRAKKTQTKEAESPAEGAAAEKPAGEKPKRAKARDLVIVSSEIAPKPEQVYDVTMKIMEVLGTLGVRETVCIDGIPRVNNGQTEMLGAGTTEAARARLGEAGIPLMKEGLVRGITGVMLSEGFYQKKDVECILCPANPQLPDPRAAAQTLAPLEKLVPNLHADPTPLTNEANDIDSRIRAQQAQQSVGTQNIYG